MAKRSRALERKKEREKQRQRNRQYLIIGIIVIAVLLVGVIFAVTNVPAEVTIPDTLDRYDNLRTGLTDEGFPRLGNPNAPITVTEYSSFSCPACQSFHESVFPQLLDRIREGVIQFVFVPLNTGSIPNPDGANRTALCAGQQGQFWEMHDVLFHWHETYVNAAFQDNRLRAGVDALGLNADVFSDCFRSSAIEGTLLAAQTQGVTVTPTVQINGVTVDLNAQAILDAIDSRGPFNNLESGTISDATDETSDDSGVEETDTTDTEDVEATDEPEATEAAVDETDDAETESDAENDDAEEATEEAGAEEATEEAESD